MESISMGTDSHGISKQAGPGKLPGFGQIRPNLMSFDRPANFFFQAMEKRRVWGSNCHLRHVARGFSNRVRNALEQTVQINGSQR